MIFEAKKSTDKWYPVRLVDSLNLHTPETGIAYSSVTCKYGTEGASAESTYTVGSANWKEQGDGNYWLQIGASEFTSEAKYIVKVEATGCDDYNFVVQVRDKTIAEMIDDVVAILDDTGTSGVILADNAITAQKIATGAITDSKIAAAAITSSKIAADAIANSKIADDAITASKLATDAIAEDALASSATAEIATAVMAKIVDGTIDVTKALKLMVAVLAGDIAKSSNTYIFKDQSGATAISEDVTTSTVTRTIS